MATNGCRLGEVWVGAGVQSHGEHRVVGAVARQDGRNVASEGFQSVALVAEGKVAVRQKRDRHYDEIADQVGHDIREELSGAKNNRQPEDSIPDADGQEPD